MEMDSALEEEMNFLTQDDDDVIHNYYYSSSEELTHFSPPINIKREKSVDILDSQPDPEPKSETVQETESVHESENILDENKITEIKEEIIESNPIIEEIFPPDDDEQIKESTPEKEIPKERSPSPKPQENSEKCPKISSRRQTVEEEEELDGFADVIYNGSYVEISLDDDDEDDEDDVSEDVEIPKETREEEEKKDERPESADLEEDESTVINQDHNYVTKSSNCGDFDVRSFLIEYLEKKSSTEKDDVKMRSFIDEIMGRLKNFDNKDKIEEVIEIKDTQDFIEETPQKDSDEKDIEESTKESTEDLINEIMQIAESQEIPKVIEEPIEIPESQEIDDVDMETTFESLETSKEVEKNEEKETVSALEESASQEQMDVDEPVPEDIAEKEKTTEETITETATEFHASEEHPTEEPVVEEPEKEVKEKDHVDSVEEEPITAPTDEEKAIEDVLNKSIETIINDHKEEKTIQEELKISTNIDISVDDLLNPISESTNDEKKSDDSEETTETTDGSDDTTEDTTTSEDLPEDPPEQELQKDILGEIEELPEEVTTEKAPIEETENAEVEKKSEEPKDDENVESSESNSTELLTEPLVIVRSFGTAETQTEEPIPEDENIKKLYEFAAKLMEDCRIVSEEDFSSFHTSKIEEMKKFVQIYQPLPETSEISIQTEKILTEKRLKKRNEKERQKLLESSDDSSDSDSDNSSSGSESRKSLGSDLDLSQFLESDLLVHDEGNVDLGDSEEVFNQLEDEENKKEKSMKSKEKLTEEELERLRDEEEDKEIERLINFKGLKKRKIQIQYYTKKIEKQKSVESPKSDKKNDDDIMEDICAEAQKSMLSDDSHSEAEEEVITEQQFLEKINENTKADLLNSTSEEEDENDGHEFNDIINSEEEDENKSTPLVDSFLKNYDPFEEENASGDENEKAIDADEIKAMLPEDAPATPQDTEEKKTDSNEILDTSGECEILDEGLKRKQIRPKSLDKLLADADKRKKIAKIDEDLISLSSSSNNSDDSDVEEVASEDNSKKRMIKPMLRADQLAGETKHAQKQENDRIKRLDKKESTLQKALKEAREKGTLSEGRELILDYNSEKKEFIKVHPDLVKHLKDHQFEGIKFMYDCCYGSVDNIRKNPGSGCILAHCMGLGKTLQLIALLHTVISYKELKTSKVLVLCPKSTVMNWADEIVRWLGPLNCRNCKVFTFPDTSDIYEKLRILEEWSNSATNVVQKRVGCLLIGYEAFRTLVFYASYKKKGNINPSAIEAINTKVQKLLINPGADLVVCDEGHIIKNRKSATSLAVAEIKTAKRIILTGTPIQNNLKEYYAMVNFIKPLFLGTEREFANLYANPIKAGQHKDSSKREIKIMKQRSYVLHKKLSKFVQRKEAALLKTFLPQKYEYVLFIPMTETQNRLYEFILDVLKRVGGSKGKTLIIDYTCLRKIWTHPKVLETAYMNAIMNRNKKERKNLQTASLNPEADDDQPDDVYDSHDGVMSVTNNWWKHHLTQDDLETLMPSNKLLTMFEILRMCEEMGEKCLIFSAFVAVLNVVEHFFKKVNEQDPRIVQHLTKSDRIRNTWVPGKDFYRLDGKTPKSIRHELIKNFNSAENQRARVFLISAKAGGQGINLIGANRVIILDTSWNPSNDQQNIFRIFRLGQKKNCYIYRLIAMGTMEEKVYSRSVTKQAMSFRVVDEQQIERHYSMAELAELYTLSKPDYSERPVPTVPQDAILAYLIRNQSNLVYKYHEHDSLLENKVEQELSEQDKEDAWAAYEHDMRSTNENTFGPGIQGMYQNFLGHPSMATNYLQSIAGFNTRNFNPALPGFGLDSLGPGFSPYMDHMLNMYPNYLSSNPNSNPIMFGPQTPTSVAVALSGGSVTPNFNPNFMSSPPPSVSPLPSILNNPLSALSSLSFGHNQQRIGPSTSPFMNPRNTPPNGPPALAPTGNTHEFDMLRRKFESYLSNPNQNRFNPGPQPSQPIPIMNRSPAPPTVNPSTVRASGNRIPPGVNSPLNINPNISRSVGSLNISTTSPKSYSPQSNSPSIPTSVIMKKKPNSAIDVSPTPNKRGRSDSPQVVKTPPQQMQQQQLQQQQLPQQQTSPPAQTSKDSMNKNNVAETSRPINIGIHYPEKIMPETQKTSTLNMGIVYPSAVNTPPKQQSQAKPPTPIHQQRFANIPKPNPLPQKPPVQLQKALTSPQIQKSPQAQVQKSAIPPQAQKNSPQAQGLAQKNVGGPPSLKTFSTAPIPKNASPMPKLQPTTVNKVTLPTPKAKAGSGMQIIPTSGVVLNAAPKQFDQISPSISLTALNPKTPNTSQRNNSPSTVQRSGLQIKQVKGADGKTQIIATPSAKSFPVTLVRTNATNSPQIVAKAVPPLAKVSAASKPIPIAGAGNKATVSVNLTKLNEGVAKNTNANSQATAAAKAMISLSNAKQVVMKQGKQIVVKKVNGNGPTTVQIPQSQMQYIKKATLPIGTTSSTTNQTVPPLTISKTATGATIKKLATPDSSNVKVVASGNQPATKVVTTTNLSNPSTNTPNPTVKVAMKLPVPAKRIELNSKTLAAVKNSINSANSSAGKPGIIILDGNKKINIAKPGISNQIGNAVQNLPSGATITRVIQRKRPLSLGKVVSGQQPGPQPVPKVLAPPQKRRKVEVNAGAGTSGGQFKITNKNPPIVEID